MRWIVIGFICFVVCSLVFALARDLWQHNGIGAIVAALLLTWGAFALYGSI